MNPATAPSLPTAALPPQDFADWFSPVLVKELRQGLKTRAFVAIFILVQVVMILLVGLQLVTQAAGGPRDMHEMFNALFWAVIWLPLLVLMPARGLLAVSEEVKANTLDLVQLTRLSAFRIVLGKWVALVAQTTLLVAAVLPYAVLRYFFGQVDVVSDLTIIGLMLNSSLWMTAGAIALSSAPVVVRIIVVVCGVPFLFMGAASTLSFGGISGGFPTGWKFAGFILAFTVLYLYLLLEIAATRIAPASENHAARKRGMALAMGSGVLTLCWLADEDTAGPCLVACFPLWGWIVLEALCERTVRLPGLYRPFARRGLAGRIAGRLLYPGWATGLLFFLVLAVLVVSSVWLLHGKSSGPLSPGEIRDFWFATVLAFTAVITPLCVTLMFPRLKQPLWLYVLVQGIFALLFAIASIVAESPDVSKEAAYSWLALFPASVLFAFLDEGADLALAKAYVMVTLPVCGVIAAWLVFKGLREFRMISRLEKESAPEK